MLQYTDCPYFIGYLTKNTFPWPEKISHDATFELSDRICIDAQTVKEFKKSWQKWGLYILPIGDRHPPVYKVAKVVSTFCLVTHLTSTH